MAVIRPMACLLLLVISGVLFVGCDDTYVPPEQPTARATVPPPAAGAPPPPPASAPPPAVSSAAPVRPVNPEPDREERASFYEVGETGTGDEPAEEPVGEPVENADQTPPADRPLTVDEARAKIEELGGRVGDNESGVPTKVFLNRTSATDQQIEVLKYLTGLEVLNLTGTQVGDAGLQHLAGLTGLKRVYAAHTNITENGVQQLNQSLPDCQVYR